VVTALSALGTAGSAAATKVIEHSAGYGIQSPHTIIEKVMPAVVTVSVEIQQPVKSDVRRFVKPGEPMGPPQPEVNPFSAGFTKRRTSLFTGCCISTETVTTAGITFSIIVCGD
jgi:S1-C subfamily serine protease